MLPKSDAQLLREYAEHGADGAFAELVVRHTNLVYSAALRQVESADLAAEVTQQAFIGLARGARGLSGKLAGNASLAGWLCRSARNLSLNLRRDEFRRHTRERQAMVHLEPNDAASPDWTLLGPMLDAAMSELSEADYEAIVLRYYQNQDLRAVGLALGVTDDTAQKRVSRALEKLHDILARRGIGTSAASLALAISANAVQAAPAGLAATFSLAAAVTGTAAHTTNAIGKAVAEEKRDQEAEIKALFTPEQLAAYPQFEQAEKVAAADRTAGHQVGEIVKEFGLSRDHQDQIRAAFAQLNLKEPSRGPSADAVGAPGTEGAFRDAASRDLEMERLRLDERLKILGGVLTPEQLDAYREAQSKRIDMMAGVMKTFLPSPPPGR